MSKSYSRNRKLLAIAAIAMFFNHTVTAQEVAVVVEPSAGYDKGFFAKHGDEYLLRANGRVATRAAYDRPKPGNHHDISLSVPAARLMFSGNVFDKQIGFGSQLAFDRGNFSLLEFFGNFGLIPNELYLKTGYFLAAYSLLETNSSAKLEFNERTPLYNEWSIGTVSGISFNRNKKQLFSWDLSVFDNGLVNEKSIAYLKRKLGASLNLSINYNELDATDEVDFAGGPLRFLFSLGGFTRATIEPWKVIGYAGAAEFMTKVNYFTLNGGFLTGTPQAPLSPDSTLTKPVFGELSKDLMKFGAYGQAGYLFTDRFGLAARYAVDGNYKDSPLRHEIFAAASLYFFQHNLKLQLDGGTFVVQKEVTPRVRAQLQLAF